MHVLIAASEEFAPLAFLRNKAFAFEYIDFLFCFVFFGVKHMNLRFAHLQHFKLSSLSWNGFPSCSTDLFLFERGPSSLLRGRSVLRVPVERMPVLQPVLTWSLMMRVRVLTVWHQHVEHALIGRHGLQHVVQVHDEGRSLHGHSSVGEDGPVGVAEEVTGGHRGAAVAVER